ncbi:MAG TPA: APH(3') family aminoglycoside O-phosphotransferase [Micromonosporaceae bacterium]
MLETLRRRFRGRTWVPVTLGLSGARVWRIDDVYVKTIELAHWRDSGFGLAVEAERLRWLATQHIRVPDVIELERDDQFEWLITSALEGRTGADPWPEAQRTAVVDALADIALMLHALPIEACPFDRRLDVMVPEALLAAREDRIDLDEMDAERVGWGADKLCEVLVATRPAVEDPVVCHGDFCLPNVLLDPESLEFVGLIDVARAGVADRHLDVALITRSLSHEANSQFDPAMASRFIERYTHGSGAAITEDQLAFYRLLDEFA